MHKDAWDHGELQFGEMAAQTILLLFLWSWLLSTRCCLAPNAGAHEAVAGTGTGSGWPQEWTWPELTWSELPAVP